jgi:hypothetical protein
MLEDKNLSLEAKDYIKACDERFQKVFLDYRLYQALAILPELKSQEERAEVLKYFSLTYEDLVNSSEELFQDFEKISPKDVKEDIRYVWRIKEGEHSKGK